MNLQKLPPELITKCLGYASTRSIAKLRKTCHGMNQIIERHDLHKAVVYKASITNHDDQKIMFLENEIIVNIELEFDTTKDISVSRWKDILRLKYDTRPDMGEVYDKLFTEIRRAETLCVYDVELNARFLESVKRHKFESIKTILVASECPVSFSVEEVIRLFREFKKVELRSCELPEILLCDEVFAVIIEREVDIILVHNDKLNNASFLTDRTLIALRESPWFTRSRFDIEQTKTKFTFATIMRLILDVANMKTHHFVELNFGYLDDSERSSARHHLDFLREHPRISIVQCDPEIRYIFIGVEAEDEAAGTYSKSEFRFHIGNRIFDFEFEFADADVAEVVAGMIFEHAHN